MYILTKKSKEVQVHPFNLAIQKRNGFFKRKNESICHKCQIKCWRCRICEQNTTVTPLINNSARSDNFSNMDINH